MVIPGIDRRLLLLQLMLEVAQRRDVIDRVDVAGDDLRDGANLRANNGIAGEQGGLRISFVQIIDDGL